MKEKISEKVYKTTSASESKLNLRDVPLWSSQTENEWEEKFQKMKSQDTSAADSGLSFYGSVPSTLSSISALNFSTIETSFDESLLMSTVNNPWRFYDASGWSARLATVVHAVLKHCDVGVVRESKERKLWHGNRQLMMPFRLRFFSFWKIRHRHAIHHVIVASCLLQSTLQAAKLVDFAPEIHCAKLNPIYHVNEVITGREAASFDRYSFNR